MKTNNMIRMNVVKEMTGLSRSTIYQFIKDGKFPEQIKLGDRASGWLEAEVDDWLQERIKRSRNMERKVKYD
jgi:prophage regulatory protein